MKRFNCACGNVIFFENSRCLACSRELGWCPACLSMTALVPVTDKHFQCGHASCGALLEKCHNFAVEQVCNRGYLVTDSPPKWAGFCDYCRFNETIPDLSVPGNREKWGRLEAAKRRLLYTLDMLRLPYGSKSDQFQLPLSFDFKADVTHERRWWWAMGQEERVYTGHADGKITINLREADAVEREKTRAMFQEAHRTIIGHFRHEIGHYYWQMLVPGRCEAEFQAAFGDHQNPSYTDAQQRYYANGPVDGWPTHYISAYASMHPWEDFAETFATYLDLISVLDTAFHMQMGQSLDPTQTEFPAMASQYVQLGVVLNEMNRAMGLKDLVPEVLAPPILAKMEFVHDLVRQASRHD